MIKFVSCVLLLVAGCALTDAASVKANVDAAFFRWYNRSGSYLDFPLANASQLASLLDKNENLTIYIPGHNEYAGKDTVQYVVNGLLNYTTANVISLDYRNISTLFYLLSVAEVKLLYVAVAESIDTMVAEGVKLESIYIIGHSLGAQVAGGVGRNLKNKVPRITGLDPAGPLYYVVNAHLSASDADFVDIIHTDKFVYGLAEYTGSADFNPNGGHGPQPGCNETNLADKALCSHQRSWVFFVESCKNPHAFIGVRCDSEGQYNKGSCDGNERAVMGYYASPETKGVYYLRTTASEPYGLGEAGAPYKSS